MNALRMHLLQTAKKHLMTCTWMWNAFGVSEHVIRSLSGICWRPLPLLGAAKPSMSIYVGLFAVSVVLGIVLIFSKGVLLSSANLSRRSCFAREAERRRTQCSSPNKRVFEELWARRPFEELRIGADQPLHLLVVLGSGGHTTEMHRLLSRDGGLLSERWVDAPVWVTFVYAKTDKRTPRWIERFQSDLPPGFRVLNWVAVPRAREVGQSWITSVFTSIHACASAAGLFLSSQSLATNARMRAPAPNVVLCNGPGTCVPFCLIAFIVRIWNSLTRTRPASAYPRIIFIETVARVYSLSLTGKILYRFADRFLVQWPELARRYVYAEYYGRLV